MASENLLAEKAFGSYTLTPPSLNGEILYVRFLKERAVTEVRSQRAVYGEDYMPCLRMANQDAAVGVYEWGEPRFWESLTHVPCMQELCYISFQQTRADMSREAFLDLWKSETVQTPQGRVNNIAEAMWEFFNRPNSPAPSKAG